MTLIEQAFDKAFNEPLCIRVEKGNGFVAFMDILGFSGIKKASEGFMNTDERAAGVIFGMMEDALTEKDELIRFIDPRYMMPDEEAENYKMNTKDMERIKKDQKLISQNISISYISDSFICLGKVLDNRADASFVTTAFITLVSNVATMMFKWGLPLRGGISFGTFMTNAPIDQAPRAFLGDALIRAHSTEMEGCQAAIVFNDDAEAKCRELYCPWSYEKTLLDRMHLCRAIVARKNKVDDKKPIESEKMCINIQSTALYQNSYAKFVESSFCQHGKDVSSDKVKRKIEHTTKFLESRTILSEVYS